MRKLIETISTITPGCRDRDRLAAAVASVARLRAWLDGRDAQLASQLAQVASFPEQAIAEAARTSLRDAGRTSGTGPDRSRRCPRSAPPYRQGRCPVPTST